MASFEKYWKESWPVDKLLTVILWANTSVKMGPITYIVLFLRLIKMIKLENVF